MASDLTPVELKIIRHSFKGWHGGALVIDPDGAIARFVQSFRGGSSLWKDGPWYQTTRQGIELREDASRETIALLTWSRIKQWVLDLPRAERDALCAAETVYRQRRRTIADARGIPDDTDLGVREAEAVRDAAFQRCVDASATTQPALFDVTEQQAVPG
ncbi:hypothetical protein [Jiangella rhizosphaerae]|uniref:Uncharacterized protein n=1 Tax=Jiangella rhizosphaerae TaxID=2293569 RepID=A0A418KY14_9ACTN|nr:hypothetical protein [Jiangella rhizosphaerae]RIQ36975.1 hypothetical protein DY240_01185 [Jiangella rhizosphaerae]